MVFSLGKPQGAREAKREASLPHMDSAQVEHIVKWLAKLCKDGNHVVKATTLSLSALVLGMLRYVSVNVTGIALEYF